MPRAIKALIEKAGAALNGASVGLTKWEHQKLENHALDLKAREQRVIKPGKPRNRVAKRAKTRRTITPGAFGKVAS